MPIEFDVLSLLIRIGLDALALPFPIEFAAFSVLYAYSFVVLALLIPIRFAAVALQIPTGGDAFADCRVSWRFVCPMS